jgi:hypothetical protein
MIMTRDQKIFKKVKSAVLGCDEDHTICIIKVGDKFRIHKVESWKEDIIQRRFNVVKWFSNNGSGSKGYPLGHLEYACKGI